jgi:hypothetical protein
MGGQDLEAIWKEKWMQAKTNLELAIVHFTEVERVPQKDYQRWLQTLAVSVNEYSRVLRIYTDLAHGKIPADQ